MASFLTFATCLLTLVPTNAAQTSPHFPVVDLGYARHAPTYVKQTSGQNISYATYANIRFAQPPVGDLRYRAPRTPPPSSEGVQNGTVPMNSTNCLQSIPPGLELAPGIAGITWGSEDCLFLDVKVPEGAQGKSLPVLHWLYGGGFFFGAKEWAGNPAGLFEDMLPDEEFITVSSNYRLSAYGWMYSEGQDMTPNAGLWDSLVALNWTKNYIHLFGGDPDRITVIGESAGSGIGVHLLTAWGGERDVPFSQAILTSPGYHPHVNRSRENTEIYNMYLNATNCTDLACLRAAPTEVLIQADEQFIFNLNQSEGWIGPSIGFGPHPDGDLVPRTPELLLADGKYHKSVRKVLTATMVNDGTGAVVTQNELSDWRGFLRVFMRTPTAETVEKVRNMYPPIGEGGFNTFAKDAVFACQAQLTAKAWGRNAYRYSMSIPPGTHGEDQFYYLFVDETSSPAQYPRIAKKLQKYFRNFILDGAPGGGSLDDAEDGSNVSIPKAWLPYGRNETWMNITADGFVPVQGEAYQAKRCDLLLESLRDTRNGLVEGEEVGTVQKRGRGC